MNIEERCNNVEHLEFLLGTINNYITEYNNIILKGNREVISRWEDSIRSIFKMDEDECCHCKLKSVKGNILWNLVRIIPGYRYKDHV